MNLQITKTSVMSIAHIISTYLCLFIIILYLYIWVQPASHHLYTNLHINLQKIAHLLQNISHHLHTLVHVKAPAHERVICSSCVINLAFFAVRHKCRTLHAPQCRERQSLPCARGGGLQSKPEGLSSIKCDSSHLNSSLFIIHYSFVYADRRGRRSLQCHSFDMSASYHISAK